MIDHDKYFSIAKYFTKYNGSTQKYINKIFMEMALVRIFM